MIEFNKFPSIEQFRNIIKQVHAHAKYHEKPIPTLEFTGTVKLHGTNSAIGYDVKTQEKIYQSRERILTLTEDNAGFMLWASGNDYFDVVFEQLKQQYNAQESIYIYGEWAGGNIQKGVGISNIPKAMFVFSVVVDGVEVENTVKANPEHRVFNINDYQTWKINIDFNRPDLFQNQLVEWTIDVENACPVAKSFGFDNTIGEGIVWFNKEHTLRFKTKGEKHSSTKVKTVKEIASVDIELMNSMIEFVDLACSENRLNQGLDKLTELGFDNDDSKNTGEFIKWVAGDIFKEEADTIVANQFDTKKLGGLIAKKSREFYLGRV